MCGGGASRRKFPRPASPVTPAREGSDLIATAPKWTNGGRGVECCPTPFALSAEGCLIVGRVLDGAPHRAATYRDEAGRDSSTLQDMDRRTFVMGALPPLLAACARGERSVGEVA